MMACLLLFRRPSRPPQVNPIAVRNIDLWGEKVIVDGNPLPGRPEQSLPLTTHVFSELDFQIDGEKVDNSLITLEAGRPVQIAGRIKGDSKYFVGTVPRPTMDAGLGLACRSDNDAGWMIINETFFGGSQSNDVMTFEGTFTVKAPPGEYVLVVLYSAHVGAINHPVMMAAEFDAVVK